MKHMDKSRLKNLFLILLSAGLAASITIAIAVWHQYTALYTIVTELCAEAMQDTELTLRQDPVVDAVPIYHFDEITAIYPTTYYKKLAEALLPLTDPRLAQQLTSEDRTALADCMHDAQGTEPDFKTLLGNIHSVIAPYLYRSE